MTRLHQRNRPAVFHENAAGGQSNWTNRVQNAAELVAAAHASVVKKSIAVVVIDAKTENETNPAVKPSGQ